MRTGDDSECKLSISGIPREGDIPAAFRMSNVRDNMLKKFTAIQVLPGIFYSVSNISITLCFLKER